MNGLIEGLTTFQIWVSAGLAVLAVVCLWNADLGDPAKSREEIPGAPMGMPAWVGLVVAFGLLVWFAAEDFAATPVTTPAVWSTWLLVGVLIAVPVVYFLLLCKRLAENLPKDGRPKFDVLQWIGRVLAAGCMNIIAFAWAMRLLGVVPPDGTVLSKWDIVYLSIVTFSTLGYGDFQPASDTRMIAAAEAVIGNLHLGLFIGLILVAVSRSDG